MTTQQERFKDRDHYEAPEAEILEVGQEGVICASGGAYPHWDQENV